MLNNLFQLVGNGKIECLSSTHSSGIGVEPFVMVYIEVLFAEDLLKQQPRSNLGLQSSWFIFYQLGYSQVAPKLITGIRINENTIWINIG